MEKRIYMKEWLILKPYEISTTTDMYYLRLCNDVKNVIFTLKKEHILLQVHLDHEELHVLCCFLTSYFEDLISETNIWNAFIKIHTKLYNKSLPFYNLSDYQDGEINVQDLSFLIWYFLNTVQEEKFISPFNKFIEEIAKKVYDVFDKEWEFAPENDYLKEFYQMEQNEVEFYNARCFIDTILLKTYLFYPDTLLKFQYRNDEVIEDVEKDDKKFINIMFNENRELTIHSSFTKLLSLNGKEWAAEILGDKHFLYEDFLSMSKRIQGLFLYKGQDENNYFIEHIASSKSFILTKKSFESKTLKDLDTIIFIGIVLWKDEWWFSGVYYQQPFNPELVMNEKNSIEKRSEVDFLDHQEKKSVEILEKQLLAFKNYNHGSQIAFLEANKMESFYQGFIDYYNKSLNLSEKELKETEQRLNKEHIFETKVHLDIPKGIKSGLVFFNPKSGCEIVFDLNSAFPMPSNPFFNEMECKEHVLDLLFDDSISPELVWFCLDHCKNDLPYFTLEVGERYLLDLDFLLRFWKNEYYYSQPSFSYSI